MWLDENKKKNETERRELYIFAIPLILYLLIYFIKLNSKLLEIVIKNEK